MEDLVYSFLLGSKYEINKTFHPKTLDKTPVGGVATFTGYEQKGPLCIEFAIFVNQSGDKLYFNTSNLNQINENSYTFRLWSPKEN